MNNLDRGMRKTNLETLARYIQNTLTQPDRATDWAIHLRNGLDGVGAYGNHPAYTGSVDAALTLIPKDHDYILEHVNGGLTVGCRVGHNDPDRTSWGQTDALAICAASLRAEAHLI